MARSTHIIRALNRMLLASTMAAGTAAFAQSPSPDPLRAGFETPPDSARPRVWWHWLSGNIAKQGITLDLEWMKRVGLGGVQMFDGDMGAPQIVDHRVKALTPEWRDDLRFAAAEADRLGLEFGMAAAPGWSETGGPWVPPESGMKKVVWSETQVTGGRPFTGRLAPPPSVPGPFQAIPMHDPLGRVENTMPGYVHDVAVIAYRAPTGETPLAALRPTMTSSAPGVDLPALVDGDLNKSVTLPTPTPSAPVWIAYAFAKPATMRALSMVGPLGGRFATGPQGRIEASDDGVHWRAIRTITGPAHNPAPQRTFAFPATTARWFRVIFDRPEISQEPYPHPPGIALNELMLVPGARVDLFEDKAGFGVMPDLDADHSPQIAADAAIARDGIVDLTAKLRPDGSLDWTPPKGEWVVLRMGYSPTGEVNHPATPEATGPEADKLNAAHVRAHLDAYMAPVIKELGPLIGDRGLKYLITDSWEAGDENWTEAMAAEFKRRRGYDLTPWLPVLAGRVVGSAAQSDAFLWDFRRTLADLLAENHYGTITRFAKEHKLGYYGEAEGAAWPTVADGMLAKSYTDIPMGEFWAMPFGGKPAAYQGVRADEFPADVIETASTAHVYGKPLVAAESFTSSQPLWTTTPWKLKWVADKYMAMGVNRLVIHTSPHQPDDAHKPGLTLGPFGQTFTRNETWAEMAQPWVEYLARGSYLLQQGTAVADILYFYGEGAPSGVPYRAVGQPADPKGYGFDYVNADALLRLATVKDGRIVFPGGASYAVLALPDTLDAMTLPMIEKIRDLVAAGARVTGPKPVASPSLASDADTVRTIADELWGDMDGRILTRHAYGRGEVFWGPKPISVLGDAGVPRDFDFAAADPGFDLRFAHRRLGDGDIYFVTNQSDRAGPVTTDFRVTGYVPELWHADSGKIEPVGYEIRDGITRVSLTLEPYEAVFVVFRAKASGSAGTAAAATTRTIADVTGPWTLHFPAGWGAPPSLTMDRLASWTNNTDPAVRYFSGVGTYEKVIDVSRAQLAGAGRLVLDLGAVGEVAEVRIDGKSAGTAWKPPYRVDVTDSLHAGRNRVEIRVANVWRNRLVGDKQPGTKPLAFTNAAAGGGFAALGGIIDKDTALSPSGLLGPVKLERIDSTGR
ncbi:glycosyl hydrolase [Sphingomonas nostoxanthinifaciens]|uniref:glycosyl hydrolase n=1 Tax=Sphingomonas nostoxanthinifaciens TaxID=2872652 RepID=UPI001CC1DF85|nr:glycosyl hydrolase [Sphingomonas nostoxanthinifaciens]UAK23120.1 glycoside hydrolase [Sphingomonas nostoxanthinifaciens]